MKERKLNILIFEWTLFEDDRVNFHDILFLAGIALIIFGVLT